jgi:hypothetical protein
VALLLVGVWCDLLWELSPELRIATSAIALVGSLCVIGTVTFVALRSRSQRALAQRLDQVGGTGGEILSGVDLLAGAQAGAPLTRGLTALAVERAGRLAAQVPGGRAISARPVGWSLGAVTLLAAAVALVAVCLPRLAETQWWRFTDPFGDHPPYSRVLYHVVPGDIQVVYGGSLDIRVVTEGPPVDRLQLVLLSEDGGGGDTLPMFPEQGGEWRATLTNVTAPGRYFVRSSSGRSPRYDLSIFMVPLFESVRFRVTPPAYTNLPPYEGPLPQGGLAGLPGTRVQLWAKSNRPLSGGALEAAGLESAVPLTPISPGSPEATAAFEIRKAGKLQVKLIDSEGRPSTDPFTTSVALLTDEKPSIRLLEPPALSFAVPNVPLPVVVAAEDDYGISRIELFRSLNDSRPLPVNVPVKMPPPTRWSATTYLPLSSYGLEPGDEIKLFARVEDNDPAGAKGAESPIVVVRIISQEEFERMVRARQGLDMLMSKYRQAQRRLENLAADVDALRKKVKDAAQQGRDDLAKQAREDLAKLAQKMRDQSVLIQALSRRPLGYDLDRHLTEHLDRLTRRLDKAVEDAEKLARASNQSPEELAKALEELRDRLHRQQDELAREALDPLEHLAAIHPLLEDASRFVIIYQRQRALAERLKSLKDQERIDDPKQKPRLRDLQTEQEEIRTDLAKLLDEIEEHMTKLPDDPALEDFRKSVLDFVDAVRGSGASEAMQEAEAGLASLSGKRAHAGATRAADILEKFLDKAQGEKGMMGQGMRACRFKPSLDQGLGNTIEQLLEEAGLRPGMEGQGGRGSSMRRSTLDNVGLYGGLPGMEDMPPPTGPARAGRGAAGGTGAGGGERGKPGATAAGNNTAGSSGSEAQVPTLYRRRVAEYFQRIADETGGK